MEKCFMCGLELTESNKTTEHILLNAIGGTLKSDKLICEKCNSLFGEKMDKSLFQQLHPFALLLNISRNRGKTQPLIATRSNGEKIRIYPDGKLEAISPTVQFIEDDGKKRFEILARDAKESKKIFDNIKKKYPSATLISTNEKTEYIDEKITFSYDFGGDALLSICKTAICYYLHIGQNQEFIQDFINKFKERNIIDFCNFCYLDKNLLEKEADGIYHSIAIVGDSDERILYAYVELFNFYKVIILLNNNYVGEKIINVYSYNLLKRKQSNSNLHMHITRSNIEEILKKNESEYRALYLKELNTAVRDIQEIKAIDKIIKKVLNDFSSVNPDDLPIDIFSKELAKRVVQEIYKK